MALRGKKPEVAEKRLKLFLYGPAGVGKTTAAIQMPNPYIIDTEKGTEQKAYVEKIQAVGGAVFRTTSASELLDELKSLMTEKHTYKTLVIDPVTNIEDGIIADANDKYKANEKEGGDRRVWGDRDRVMRRIRSMLLNIDMNVVITAHGKIEYGDNFTKLGQTFEGWKKWPYIFDLVLELDNQGKRRVAVVKKSRMAMEFPDGDQFEWSYEELSKRYNPNIMEKDAVAITLATPEQIEQIRELASTMHIDEDWIGRAFKKADVECWDDMPADMIQKCIDYQLNRLHGLKNERMNHAV